MANCLLVVYASDTLFTGVPQTTAAGPRTEAREPAAVQGDRTVCQLPKPKANRCAVPPVVVGSVMEATCLPAVSGTSVEKT